jgi:hypothetical protein
MGTSTRTHAINPDCAAKMERTATILDGVVADVKHITEVIYGNGKPGIKELLEGTIRKIDELTVIVQGLAKDQKAAAEAKEKEKSDVRSDVRKFGLQSALTVIVGMGAVAQAVVIAWLVGK